MTVVCINDGGRLATGRLAKYVFRRLLLTSQYFFLYVLSDNVEVCWCVQCVPLVGCSAGWQDQVQRQDTARGEAAYLAPAPALELQTKFHPKVRYHGEGPYLGLLLIESAY